MKKSLHLLLLTALYWMCVIIKIILCIIISLFVNPLTAINPASILFGIMIFLSFQGVFLLIFYSLPAALLVVIFMHYRNYDKYWQWLLAGIVAGTLMRALFIFSGHYSVQATLNTLFSKGLLFFWNYSAPAALIYCLMFRIEKNVAHAIPPSLQGGEAPEAIQPDSKPQ